MDLLKSFKIFRIISPHHHATDTLFIAQKSDVFNILDFSHAMVTKSAETPVETNIFEKNVELFAKLKKQKDFGAVVTSVKEIQTITPFASLLYIPGELCRQSDILEACSHLSIPVLLEKGCFLAPNDLLRMIEKIKSNSNIALVEAGSAFGYSDRVLDPRSLFLMQQTGIPFGLHLDKLLLPEQAAYAHKPSWLTGRDWSEAYINTGKTFGARFFVTVADGKSDQSEEILQKLR